jgi:hypothetical protein
MGTVYQDYARIGSLESAMQDTNNRDALTFDSLDKRIKPVEQRLGLAVY